MAILLFGLCGEPAAADPDDLRSQLVEFAQERDFAIAGLQWIGREAAANAQGSASDRLNLLLQDYNYMFVQDGLGRIEKVVITSRKSTGAAGSAGSANVLTVRVGNHHCVDTDITGPNHIVRTVRLLIDTGATSLVLPTSLIPDLGFRPQDLRPGTSQVVGGTVPTLIGTAGVVRVGTASADNISVNFVDDEKLHGTMLLGMSFLRRFRATLDDQQNELVLLPK